MSQPKTNKNNIEQKVNYFIKCIGEEMFALRKSHKKSIKTVAKDTKMSPGILSKVENGTYDNLCMTRLLRLCKYYSADIRDIIDRAEFKDRNNTI
jgi:transcriptional regulator with XRE-family HTH domain